MNGIEIIIPSLNGRKLLEECLPKIVEMSREDEPPAKITIVDDGSTDGSVEWLAANFPEVSVLALPERRGFTGAVNAGIFASSADIILLLNNDMIPNGAILPYIREHFEDSDVAAAGLRVLTWDGSALNVGRKVRFYDRGMVGVDSVNEDCPVVSYTFFASGGAMAVRRRHYIELGGLCELFAPGYVEDMDFCYRAWKRGLKIVWEPRASMLHKGSATFAPRRPFLKWLVKACNPDARREFRRRVPGKLLGALASGDFLYPLALCRAIFSLQELKQLREREAQSACLGDIEVFDKINRLSAAAQSGTS